MSKIIKARVLRGRYSGETVRITNISLDELGGRKAACLLGSGIRANLPVEDLEVIEDAPEPEIRKAKTASMPFVSGSTSSRSMTHTRNMNKLRLENKNPLPAKREDQAVCESCGNKYNKEERKGMPGKITDCAHCAEETESKVEGKMIFSHKTGATIEIKKDGELRHEAETFDQKNRIS